MSDTDGMEVVDFLHLAGQRYKDHLHMLRAQRDSQEMKDSPESQLFRHLLQSTARLAISFIKHLAHWL